MPRTTFRTAPLVFALTAAVSAAHAAPPASTPAATAAIAESTNAILQGDSQRALLEAKLLATLRKRIGPDANDAKDMDALEPILQGQLL
ncbi:MAG TPA: hypothetical protein VGD42_09800, partial [Lysobacter sp.]